MSKTQLLLLFLLIPVFYSCSSHKESTLNTSKLTFESLTCNSKENPTAIESKQPLFSWIVKADGFNRSQTAYQVLVASSEEKLNNSDADIWNSRKINSNTSVHIKYKGEALEAMKTYYWKVKIWDEQHSESNWSKIQKFEMGLLNNNNWGILNGLL